MRDKFDKVMIKWEVSIVPRLFRFHSYLFEIIVSLIMNDIIACLVQLFCLKCDLDHRQRNELSVSRPLQKCSSMRRKVWPSTDQHNYVIEAHSGRLCRRQFEATTTSATQRRAPAIHGVLLCAPVNLRICLFICPYYFSSVY